MSDVYECDYCDKEFDSEDEASKHEAVHKKKKDILKEDLKQVKEVKCKCKECGKVWHYLQSEYNDLSSSAMNNAVLGFSNCGSFRGDSATNKSLEYRRRADALRKCPECGSRNFDEQIVSYAKKSNLLVLFSVWLIKNLYRKHVYFLIRRNKKIFCRFFPSCSEYSIIALEKYGFLKGWYLTLERLKRCNWKYNGRKIDFP
jgi:putative component of membrane protein insertase Oxa1/YidC/SpoIIIJ protein YidD/uncharacterized OB-fold protein